MIIVGEFLHKNKSGLLTSTCSNIYSSVARLNKISFDSAIMISTAAPFCYVNQLGQAAVEKYLLLLLTMALFRPIIFIK